MKTKLMIFFLILQVLFVASVYSAVYPVPSSGLTTNPQGQWNGMYGPTGWSTVSQLTPFTSDGLVPPNWLSTPNYFMPRLLANGELQVGTGGWGNGSASLVFECPQTGYYSLEFIWNTRSLSTDPVTNILSVRTAPNTTTASTLLWSISHAYTTGLEVFADDLSLVGDLTTVYLTQGSYIIIDMQLLVDAAGWPGASASFSEGSIFFTTLPSTKSFSVPSAGFTTNPQGPWSGMCTPVNKEFVTLSELTLLTQSGSNWASPGWYPYIDTQTPWGVLWKTASGGCGEGSLELVFKAPASGSYSVDFDWNTHGQYAEQSTTEILEVYTFTDTTSAGTKLWTTSHTWETPSFATYTDDLGTVSALQGIQLQKDNYIVFVMKEAVQTGYPSVGASFGKGIILFESNQVGDIFGPAGEEDSRVNFYDIARMAEDWGQCINPDSIDCVLD